MAKIILTHLKDTKNCAVFEPPAGSPIRSPLYLDKSRFGGKPTVTLDIAA